MALHEFKEKETNDAEFLSLLPTKTFGQLKQKLETEIEKIRLNDDQRIELLLDDIAGALSPTLQARRKTAYNESPDWLKGQGGSERKLNPKAYSGSGKKEVKTYRDPQRLSEHQSWSRTLKASVQ